MSKTPKLIKVVSSGKASQAKKILCNKFQVDLEEFHGTNFVEQPCLEGQVRSGPRHCSDVRQQVQVQWAIGCLG